MASTVQQAEVVPNSNPPADVVGRAFVHQYYLILHKSPELVHRFYQEHSILSRADENGFMSTTTTMQAINDKILSYDYGSQSAEITTVDAQDSYSGGVLVLVTGYLTGAGNSRQKFTQSFYLAPQDTGFYVYNDVFRYVVKGGNPNESQALASDPEGPLSPEQDFPALQNQVSETEVEMSDDVGPDEKVDAEVEVCDTNTGDKEVAVEEEKAPVTVVVAEIPKESTLVKPISKIEEAPKKSYASILSTLHVKAVKESVAPLPAPTRAPLRIVQKNQEPTLAAPTPISETVVSGPNVNENGKVQEVEDGFSVYIRGLPMNTTPTLVGSEFKKFGPIKADGIQVKFNKGFCFGFVEFEEANAVQSAIEASPIKINGRNVFIEEKRSTYRGGGYRGRFSGPRGHGGRGEGMRGRGGGYGGGRGYGRGGDFGSRNGGRGGGAAYPRDENGEGRENRDGLLGAAENAVKSTSIRVSASA